MVQEIDFIKNCRLCESSDLDVILEWGEVALANNYRREEELNIPEKKYPLTILKCGFCGHIQLKEDINPEILFSNYLYASSTSGSLAKYFREQYVPEVIEFLKLKEGSFVIDLGGNDGVTLLPFKERGFKCLNVEPAKNLAKISEEKGIETISEFFTEELSYKIKEKYGFLDLIIINNAYMHLSNHRDFTKGIKILMGSDTKFVFENSYYLEVIKQNLADQHYQDHKSYLTIKSIYNYLLKFDLELFYIKETPVQCGSLRCFVKNKENNEPNELIKQYIKKEEDFGLYNLRTYYEFMDRVMTLRENFLNVLADYRNKGKSISCYACPAKFLLFSKIFGLNNSFVKYVVDDSKFKQGLLAPNNNIKIVSPEYFKGNPTDVCVISASNFVQFIKDKNKWYKGVWLNPFETINNVYK